MQIMLPYVINRPEKSTEIMPLNTPVVFCIFRRPETTRQVFERIAQAQPRQLFVIADGPRNPEEALLCEQTRAIIQVDWPCEVRYNYAEQNMGLKARISSGLDWVFEQVEQAIILEDDCLPHATFFRFCEELLEHYKDDERVMHIGGNNFGYQRPPSCTDSYYFSRYTHIWGWATWRRAWAKYDVDMKDWRDAQKRRAVLLRSPWWMRSYWTNIYDAVDNGRIHTWDYQWLFASVLHDGLAVVPFENLVAHIGVGEGSTHFTTASLTDSRSFRTLYPVAFPLSHPQEVRLSLPGEAYINRFTWLRGSRFLFVRIYRKLRKWLKGGL